MGPCLNSQLRQEHRRSHQPSITRLGILLLLFDVYLTWARIEKQSPLQSLAGPPHDPTAEHAVPATAYLASKPIGLQYLFFRESCSSSSPTSICSCRSPEPTDRPQSSSASPSPSHFTSPSDYSHASCARINARTV